MSNLVNDYNFKLPNELIAQSPLIERASSRLLVLNKNIKSANYNIDTYKKKIFIISRINNGPVVFWIYPSCKRSNTINDYNFITFF